MTSRSRSISANVAYSRSSSLHRDLSDLGWETDHNWMFGMTGEQEWSLDTKIGACALK